MTINLHANESPFLPDIKIQNAVKKGLENINRYPGWTDIIELKKQISTYNTDFPPAQIILSHGSDLLLHEIINFFSKDRKIMMISPSFFSVSPYAIRQALKLTKIQLSPPDFMIDADVLLNELDEPTLLLIDNPNNPTGKIVLDTDFVKKILRNKNTLLLVDEAYFEFSGQTFAGLLIKYPNLAITRTMDKAFSLAGLRLGYLLAGDSFLKYFSNYPQLLSRPTLLAAIESFKNLELMRKNVAKLVNERGRVSEKLKELGFEVFHGEANYLLIKSKIPELAMKLRNKEILIHDLSGMYLEDFYRITIGNSKENNSLINAI